MSYASNAHAGRAPAGHALSAAITGLKDRMARRRAYRQTVNALSELSNRELADLGLTRNSIESQAWQAVHGMGHKAENRG